jgi:hypothetical protein
MKRSASGAFILTIELTERVSGTRTSTSANAAAEGATQQEVTQGLSEPQPQADYAVLPSPAVFGVDDRSSIPPHTVPLTSVPGLSPLSAAPSSKKVATPCIVTGLEPQLADDSGSRQSVLIQTATDNAQDDRLPTEVDPLQMGLFSELEAATLFTQ